MDGSDRQARIAGEKIGYVRVSDKEQTESLQIDALLKAGCNVIYGDHGVSGAITKRKGLDDLLDDLRTRGVDYQALTQGIDTTTAVGRMLYGQLAVFAEFEREQIRERTKAGMEAARKRGKHIGRPRKLTDHQVETARKTLDAQQGTITSLAKSLGVAPLTLSRALRAKF